MKYGEQLEFYNVSLYWPRGLQIRRGLDLIVEIKEATHSLEETFSVDGEQSILFCRVFKRGGGSRAFFIDDELGQTSVREVPHILPDIQHVLSWLLPIPYHRRQGDVGIYELSSLPSGLTQVGQGGNDGCFRLFGGRHILFPTMNFSVFEGRGRYFVLVKSEARLSHPEHSVIQLKGGCYELRVARGTPLVPRSGSHEVRAAFL